MRNDVIAGRFLIQSSVIIELLMSIQISPTGLLRVAHKPDMILYYY